MNAKLTPEQQAVRDNGPASNNDQSFVDPEGYRWITFQWVGPDGVRHDDRQRLDTIMFFSRYFRYPKGKLRHKDNDPANCDIDNLVEDEGQ